MVTVAPGKHRRPDWPPDETGPWSPWGAPPLLHPDHPSAPVPRVRTPPSPGSGPVAEAEHLRAVMVSLADQLGEMAAYIAENLAPPPARPLTRPARPATRHARQATGTQGRQAHAARKMVALLAALVTVGVVSGATELALHGGPFFIFRANGAGATETGPVEDQGPGQPDAPGAHHVPAPRRHVTTTEGGGK